MCPSYFGLYLFHLLTDGFSCHLCADNFPCVLHLSLIFHFQTNMFNYLVGTYSLVLSHVPKHPQSQTEITTLKPIPSPIFIVSMNDTPIYPHTGPHQNPGNPSRIPALSNCPNPAKLRGHHMFLTCTPYASLLCHTALWTGLTCIMLGLPH